MSDKVACKKILAEGHSTPVNQANIGYQEVRGIIDIIHILRRDQSRTTLQLAIGLE